MSHLLMNAEGFFNAESLKKKSRTTQNESRQLLLLAGSFEN